MKLRKLFVGCVLVFTIILSNSRIDNKFVLRKEIVSADASGTWKKSNDGRWWFAYSSGGYAVGWEIIGGKWYHFNSSGWMETGWLELEGKTYYLNASGAMEIGWLEFDGKWYYLDNSGVMKTGWLSLDGKTYYLNASGAMEIGWLELGGNWYYLDNSGVRQSGWLYLGEKTYYFFSTGEMAVGVTVINKIEYFFDGDGELSQNDKAWSVGINYEDFSLSNLFPVDTTRDAVEAWNFYKQMGYDAECHTLPTYEVLSSNASNNMPRLSSAIQMYSGHGSSEGMIFFSNEIHGLRCKTGIRRKNSKSVKGFDFVRLSKKDMKNVKLIIFAGCNTANGSNNIAKEANEMGAKISIGWTVSVNAFSHSAWLYRFNEHISKGYTIKESMEYADEGPLMHSSVRKHFYYGDLNTYLGMGSCTKSSNNVDKRKINYYYGNSIQDVYSSIKKIDESFLIKDYKQEFVENQNGKYYQFYKLKDGAKTLIGYTVSVVDGRIKVFKNDEKFDINKNNTVEKDSKTNIENKLRSKSLGEYKIISSERIYQDGNFYTLHSVEHTINNSKMVIDIYEKE